MHQQGVVLLTVQVGADGHASDVTLSRSSGFPLLDQAALRTVRQWRFYPARAGGLPVASQVEVPVRFSLAQ
jgi:protein TonB